MTIKLKYSDEPIEVPGMSFDEDGVFKGYFKEGDPAAPVKTDEFYPKEDCAATSDPNKRNKKLDEIALEECRRAIYSDMMYGLTVVRKDEKTGDTHVLNSKELRELAESIKKKFSK